ncbi:MAG: sugar phosphate isomerase/epimerase [Spirochaetales bacterium]|nr:sugar phosphate isomerase/epimerase [Spirochaetales bacterium]
MRISTDTFAIINAFGEEPGLKLIKDCGFEAVDFSLFNHSPAIDVLDSKYRDRALQTREILENVGLKCSQAHSPYRFLTYESALDMSNMDFVRMLRSIEYASIIGSPCIVVHGFADPKGPFSEECMVRNINYYNMLKETAQKFGIHISIENMIRNCLNTPQLMNSIIDRLDSDVFNLCLDIGHCQVTGFRPQDFIRGLDPGKLKILHVQDNTAVADDHMLPFLCKIEWEEVLKALAEYGYDGNISLEITSYYNRFPVQLLPKAVELAAQTADYLRSRLLELSRP